MPCRGRICDALSCEPPLELRITGCNPATLLTFMAIMGDAVDFLYTHTEELVAEAIATGSRVGVPMLEHWVRPALDMPALDGLEWTDARTGEKYLTTAGLQEFVLRGEEKAKLEAARQETAADQEEQDRQEAERAIKARHRAFKSESGTCFPKRAMNHSARDTMIKKFVARQRSIHGMKPAESPRGSGSASPRASPPGSPRADFGSALAQRKGSGGAEEPRAPLRNIYLGKSRYQ